MYYLVHFSVSSLVMLDFSLLWNRFPEQFILQKCNSIPVKKKLPISPSPSPCNHHSSLFLWIWLLLLLLSRFSHGQLYATPEMAARQAPPSLGFSRQEHWSGLPFPSNHVSGLILHFSYCAWLRPLSITSSKFIHDAACVIISFLFKAE